MSFLKTLSVFSLLAPTLAFSQEIMSAHLKDSSTTASTFTSIAVPFAFSLDGNQNYGVTGGYPGNITFFDKTSNNITGTVDFPYSAYVYDLSVRGSLTIASDDNSGILYSINQPSYQIIGGFDGVDSSNFYNFDFQNDTTLWGSDSSICQLVSFDYSNPSSPSLAAGSISFLNVASYPSGMALNGTTLAVMGYLSSTAAIINNSTKNISGSISGFSYPWQVATNGTVWAASQRVRTNLKIFNPLTNPSGINVNIGMSSLGIAMNADKIAVGFNSRTNARILFLSANSPYTILGTVNLSSSLGARDVVLNGTTAYVAAYDASILGRSVVNIIDANTYSIIGTVTSNVPSANGLGFNGSKLVVTNIDNNYISVFNAGPGTLTFLGSISTGLSPRTPAFFGTTCAVPCLSSSELRIYSISDATITQTGTISCYGAPNFALTNGIDWIASTSADNRIDYFNPFTQQITSSIQLAARPYCQAFNGTFGAAGTSDHKITFVNTSTNQITGSLSVQSTPQEMSSSGKIGIASLSNSNQAVLFDLESQQELATLNVGLNPSKNAIDGNYAIVVNGDKTVSVINVEKKLVTETLSFPASIGGVTLNGTQAYVVMNPSTGSATVEGFYINTHEEWISTEGSGQGAEVGRVMNAIYKQPSTPQVTNDAITEMGLLPSNQQIRVRNSFPPRFKVIQFAQEKLDLLLHKQLDTTLYGSQEGSSVFILGGYDNFNQNSSPSYSGYNVDNFYQMLGGTKDWGSMKWLAALGASESYMSLKESAKASYNTVWGSLGVSSGHKRWIYGLDGLFGYSFIDAQRHVLLLEQTARTNHGMWNLSFDAKVGYKWGYKSWEVMPYDTLGYIYGQENSYTEHGTSGDNQHVKDEHISVLRNSLGFSIKPLEKKKICLFLDGAWVYEYYCGNNNYKAAFAGTSVYGIYGNTIPARNYGRVHTGLLGSYKKLDWNLAFTGLYGKRLSDNAVSVNFIYKF